MSGWQPNKHNREAIEVALIPISLDTCTLDFIYFIFAQIVNMFPATMKRILQ